MMQPLILSSEYWIAFILGTLVGSFANVCIHRVPRQQSVIFPPSHCPLCQQAIPPWQNIPLFSYLLLRGQCAFCQSPIALRYPCIELLGGGLYLWVYLHWGFSVESVVYAGLMTSLLIITCIDLAYTIIPDSITLPGIVIGLGVSTFFTSVGLVDALLGMCIGGGLFLLIACLSRGGMGGGDIKLIAMIGAFLGLSSVLMTIFYGALSGAIIGILLIILRQKKRKDPLPFGPFLALGAFLTMTWGATLFPWHLLDALYQ